MVANVKKILINIKDNEISFSYKTSNSSINNDLLNTNIISNNELIFSDAYIQENTKILTSFIKELAIQYDITTASISKMDIAEIIINLLSRATTINTIIIKDNEPLSYTVCEALTNYKHIKNITCDSIQPFMIELLDKNNITCETRNEILFVSNFMEQNNLYLYSNIYYKTNVRIPTPLSLEDLNDFEDFCKVNKYLKTIHISKLIPSEVESIIKVLISCTKSNIKIVIHENINDEKIINILKEINKNYKRKYNIFLTLEYSEEYLNQNLFKQTIINTLKVCGLIISSLVILIVTYIGLSNHLDQQQVNKIKNNLANILKQTDNDKIMDAINKKNEENKDQEPKPPEEPENPDKPAEEEPNNGIKMITNKELASLLTINEDVIGEIKVNNTNIEYPVVQTKDNEYYLKRDINKDKHKNGWIFMDYRNDSMNLDKNNIIYGHSTVYNNVMFGELHKTITKSWYTNPENHIITYNTLYEKMNFKIFSIYKIPKTSDYLKVFFNDDNDYLNFIATLKKRSIYDFNTDVPANSKIITLSTCSDSGLKRIVVHAVLIDQKQDT